MVLPLRMSTEAFAATWLEFEDLDMPAAVFVPTWADDDEELARRMLRAATELEPIVGTDRREFFAELEAVYRSLTTAPLDYSARVVREDGSSFGIFLACHGRKAVRCIVDGDVAHLSRVDAEPDSLVDMLSYCPPARIHSASAPVRDVLGGDGESEFLVDAIDVSSPDVAYLRQLLDTDPVAKGELGVAIRPRSGRRQSHPEPVFFVDLEDVGRVAFYRDGHYVTALPGTDANLIDRLDRMRDELA